MRPILSLAVVLLAFMAPRIAAVDQVVIGKGRASVEEAADLVSDDGELNLASLLAITQDVSLF